MRTDPETEPAAIACAACRRPLVDHYFEINRTIVCEGCRRTIEDQLRGGWGVKRVARAALFGLGASLAGTVFYLPVLSLWSPGSSSVAIVNGYLVGKLVRQGGGGLGGTAGRLIAVGYTYMSLAMGYLAYALLTFIQGNQPGLPPELTPEIFLAILAQAFQMPLVRMKAWPVDLALIGFGLWVAWKLNKPGRFVVTGPHQVEGRRQSS